MPPVPLARFLTNVWLPVFCVLMLCASPCPAARPYQPVLGDPMLESWRWRTFPELSGLNAVCMAEDGHGVIWFGTTERLWSYDGVEWVHHSIEEGAMSGVLTLCGTTDGHLYAGGRWGIRRLEKGIWSRAFSESGKDFGEVRKLTAARDGSLWAATAWGGLRLQHSKWTLFTTPEMAAKVEASREHPTLEIVLLPNAVVSKARNSTKPPQRHDLTEVCEDPQGRIWFGTELGEILCYTPGAAAIPGSSTAPQAAGPGAWVIYNETDGMSCGRMASILPRRDGAVWVTYGVASGDLNQFDGKTWTAKPLTDAGLPADGGTLLETRDGVVWLSGRYVLCAYREERWRTYTKPEVPIPSARNFLLQSSDGALWIAGPGTEILRVDYQTPRWLTLQDLNFHWESPQGAQWFLHRDGRVVVCDGDRWTSYGIEDDVIDAPVALVGTRNGEVWVAGSHEHTAATARFDGRTWTRHLHPEFSWGVEWRGVLESADGSLWFSAAVDSSGPKHHRAGILQFRGGQWFHHHQPGRAPEGADDADPQTLLPATQRPEPIGKFASLAESRDGKFWAGRNILIVRNEQRWTVFTPPEGVRIGIIETMYTTRERELWIGTRQFGALRYDGRGWQSFQGKDSLVANSVRSIVQTTDGSVWTATDRDVSRFDGRTWVAAVLPAELQVPNEGGSLKASASGQLWINRFTPAWNRRAWPKTPLSDGAKIEFWTRRHQLAGTPPETSLTTHVKEVSPPGNLSVFWTGSAPWRERPNAQLQFSFRLDAQPWSAFAPDLGHVFFALSPGRHHLEVRARDIDFNVDPTPAILDFVVLPPVWRQLWFLLLMALLIGLIATQSTRVMLERSRLRRVNRNLATEIAEREKAEEALRRLNQELDQRVQARTSQLEAINKELEAFSYSVSHDLRAPLRGMAGFSQALLEDYAAKLDDEGKDFLRRIRAGALRMGRLIDDMLSLARVAREELRVGPVDLSQLVSELAGALMEREPDRKAEFMIARDVVVMGDVRFLRVALENLLDNAWKFTAKRLETTIEFGVTMREGRRVYFVRDNGAGFDMAHADRLFQAFRRLHAEHEYAGTGIGLATVYRIIRRHGGQTWAEARVDEGATIYFTLPESEAEITKAGALRESRPPFRSGGA